MPTVPMVAFKPHRYDGRLVRKGQSFVARSEDDAKVLVLMGVAAIAVAPPPPVPAAPTAPEPSAGDPLGELPATAPSVEDGSDASLPPVGWPPIPDPLPAPPDAPPPPPEAFPRPKRRYRRKDLVAED